MFKQKILFFLIVCFVGISSKIISQVAIAASPTAGCVPQTVNFSSPAGSGYFWQFGDGGTSVLQNPGHTYLTTGNFVVTYTSSLGTATLLVKINANPTANFSYNIPATHCAPETVTFVNTSTSPTTIPVGGNQWNFGNGVPSSVPSPTYSYPGGGSFIVNLTVTDNNGCSNTFTAGPINVSTPPVVIISTNPSPASGCTAPFICAFSGSNSVSGSPIPGGMSYNWNFPGGAPGSSAAQTPGNVTYPAIGSYNATLTVTDNNNCSASAVVPVIVSQPVVSVVVPSVICIYDTLKCNDNSTGSSTLWQFSDGAVLTMPGIYFGIPRTFIAPPYKNLKKYNPAWQGAFQTAGIKTVTITAFGGGTCTATQVKTITVEKSTATITATPPTFSCNSPFLCPYSGITSTNAASYFWSVVNCNGAILTSTNPSPTFTITQGSLNPYTIYPYCVPVINLVVTSAPGGCTNLATFTADTLRKPTAWFNKNKKEGCVPLTVNFRDSSQAYLPPYPFSITGYTWNNGASPPQIISGPAPTFSNVNFTYTATGTYTPFLIIQTAQGCIDTSFVDTVYVASPSPLSFSFSPNVVCPNQTVSIINTSANQNLIQHWHVLSDNGYFSGCVGDPNPGWVFTHIGAHTFTLQAWKHSCLSSTTIPQTVQVNGPIVHSRFTTNCTNRKTVFFQTEIQDAATTNLNFGDASSVVIPGVLGSVITHTINHTYANTGDYTVTVVSSNGSGTCSPFTYTMLVQVRDVQADIALSPTVCSGLSTVFSAASSTDVLVSCNSVGYTWYFDNLAPKVTVVPTISYSWAAPGIHAVVLEVKDINSCSDTTRRLIRVSSASPAFNMISPICLSTGTVQFNNTTSQLPDPITSYNWGFGDGGVSSATNPIHNYTAAAVPNSTYAVFLTATNSLGCVASTSLVMQVNNPSAIMNALPGTFICVGQTVQISAPAGYTSYSLSYGDGSPNYVGGSNATVHSYTAAGGYTASILVTDPSGCQNTSVLAFSVQSYPIANFSIISPGAQFPNVACLGNNITFSSTSTSTPTYPLSYAWDIGNGANIQPIVAVVATYTAPGVFPVTLTVTTPNGCAMVITKTVQVYSATANLNLNKTTICLGEAIDFNIKNYNNVFAWTWDFADGDTLRVYSPNFGPVVTHTYVNFLSNGSLTVSLIYYTSNYACKFFDKQVITVVKVTAGFNRNNEIAQIDSVHCIGSVDQFSNTTANAANLSFNWNFGDGNTSNNQNPTNTYSVPGIYFVTFTVVQSPEGCIGTSSKKMIINPLPTVAIAPTSTCQNQLFTLTGSGPPNLISYTWTPPFGITNPSSLVTQATASATTDYTLTVTDVNGCKNFTTQNVYIQLPPKNIKWDTTLIIGQPIPINGNAGLNLSYTWTPITDLSCSTCAYPTSTSTNNITYSVTIKDAMGCFTATNTYDIFIEPKSTVDVPTAFTPNGDGTNDIIYVDGWGIKKLKYFRIFNRWGQLLFESTDIKIGWDGTFKGVPQNMETYVYQVSAETYVDKDPVLKTGSFKLIR